MKRPVAREDGVHVLRARCATCIFRPGNLMHLQDGRVAQMVRDAVAADSCIPCHSTLGGNEAVCRGFYDRHGDEVWTLRLARGMDMVVLDPVPR